MCLTSLNEVISIIYIIIITIIIIIIIIIINCFIIMATISRKKAWGTKVFIWPKLFIRHYVIQAALAVPIRFQDCIQPLK